jgi:hypothetical protein
MPAPLGDGVHAADRHGEEQRGQDEYEDRDRTGIGHGSLTFLHEAEQSESIWVLDDSAQRETIASVAARRTRPFARETNERAE